MTGLAENAMFTLLHRSIWHLLAENIFFLLGNTVFWLYLYYALVAHIAIKLRGLAHNEK